ncbi:DMT family transporter [Halobacillus kuroshimensis]|uniref:DMT family transporter n=1 Tax=Halobacillus kuroshimensis TaxID=302481 RepID=UPI000408EC78|nr:DMT family transporter [Halobacillus kuroshimensis]
MNAHLPRLFNAYYIAYSALGIIWGTNFLFMKWAAVHISPLQIVFLRVSAGFIPVFLYALLKRQLKFSHLSFIHHFFVMSLLATVIYFYCFAKGTALLNSGIAGALSGAIPIFSTLLTFFALKDERVTIRGVTGVCIGLSGVFIIARPWESGTSSLDVSGVMYMLIGSLSVGASFVYAKKFLSGTAIAPAALTSYQILFAILFLWIFGDLDGLGSIQSNTTALAGVIIGLGIIGTGLAYILYYVIVNQLGAVTASTVTYIPPVISLLIGAFLAGEVILLSDWIAMSIILAGVMVMNRK